MKCEEALQKITPYIENRLQPRELEAFIEHIKQCPSCYDELETYYIVSRAVQYLDDEKQDTYNIMELLKRDIRMKEQGLRRRRRMHWLVFFLFADRGGSAGRDCIMFSGDSGVCLCSGVYLCIAEGSGRFAEETDYRNETKQRGIS